jgi:serine/threonine protein kinase
LSPTKTQEEEDEDGEDEAVNLLKPGKKITRDDFKTIKVIGKGSFGKVYLVEKRDNPGPVYAMKVLSKAMVAKRNLIIKTQAER